MAILAKSAVEQEVARGAQVVASPISSFCGKD